MIALPIRGRDAEAQVARAVLAAAAAIGMEPALVELRSHAWASATFVGTQVSLTLSAPRAAVLGRWLAELPLADLPMPGHLLASLAVDLIEDDGSTVTATLTALAIHE